MKKKIIYLLAAVFTLCSCHSEEIIDNPGFGGDNNNTLIQARIQGYDISDESDDSLEIGAMHNVLGTTRSALAYNSTTERMDFKWSEGDALFVCSDIAKGFTADEINRMQYPLTSGANTPVANFSPVDLRLDHRYNYFAFSPITTPTVASKASVYNREYILLDYSEQRQLTNDNTDHLSAYNFMASYQKLDEKGNVLFDFKNVSSMMRIRVIPPVVGTFVSFEVMRADGKPIKYRRILDLTDGGDATVENFTPVSYVDPTDTHTGGFVLKLGDEEGNGITTASTSDILVMYLSVPVTNELAGIDLIGKLKDNIGNTYLCSMKGYDMTADAYRPYAKKLTKSDKLLLNLTVNKLWQVGNTKEQTRAGDPGVDTELLKPNYIYIYTCKNGTWLNTIKVKTGDKNTSEPEDLNLTWADWIEDGNEWRYQHTFTIDLDDGVIADGKNIHVYVIASHDEIGQTVADAWVKKSTSETEVQNFAYTVSGTDAQKQATLMNLYSGDFVVNKGQDLIIPATIYHTCAKLDVQWNNKTNTALTGNVSVNNVPNENLKMFTPTANVAGSWAPSTAITTGTCWNGRAVFYVPQLDNQTYNITTGSISSVAKTQDVIFTAPKDNKLTGSVCAKTAWFKSNITINP